VIVPGRASALGDEGFRFRRRRPYQFYLLSNLFSKANKSKSTVQDFTSAWMIVSGQSCMGLSLVSSVLKEIVQDFTRGTRSKPNL
jgi:hypothetical protein